uniref:Uncharacterized protein n=1 Tax=Brassica oleracea var. oleracea TaxID=109376 RepID=A0A0D2ZT70_BRAOL
MNLLYEIKKKDGRTKRRRLVKRDNNNEAFVIQQNRKDRLQPEEFIPQRKTGYLKLAVVK